MPPPTKRQKNDSARSGALHGDESGRSSPAAGQAKVATNKKQRKDRADGTLLKEEWCGLSQSAQSRHVKNEIRARIRAMIPGPGKLSENGLMLQAASRIKELEIEIDSTSNYLEKLQKLQSSGESANNKLKDQTSMDAVVPAVQETKDGLEALRAVLPQPTKAKGKRLLEFAWQYLTELNQEKNQLDDQVVSIKAVRKPKTPPDGGK